MNAFRYSAFISYKHADKKYAKWIQKKLEYYHLSAAVKKETGYKKLKVCRDETDFSPNILGEEIHRMLTESNYLIVICSKTLAAQGSVYVDDEIRYFLSLGRQNRIILLMPDAEVGNEAAYIPGILRNAGCGNELLGINMKKDGKSKSFYKVLARVLERNFDDFYKRERRRKRAKIAGITVTAAVVSAFVATGLWMYLAPHTAYYYDYVEKYGVPYGICRLSKEEAANTFRHYAIVTQRGKVRELRYENSAFRVDDHIYATELDLPVHAKYKYYEGSDSLESVTFYDKYGKKGAVYKYNKKATVVQLLSDSDGDLLYKSVNASSTSFSQYYEKALAPKSNITQYLLSYDEDGRLKSRHYAYGDTHIALADANGIYGIKYEHDDEGRITSYTYLTYDRETDKYIPTNGANGASKTVIKYDDNFCKKECRFYDKSGSPCIIQDFGYSIVKDRYDKNRNTTEEYVYDTDNNPVVCYYGFASATMKYRNGFQTATQYYGLDGNETDTVFGYSCIKQKHNSNGDMTEALYFLSDGTRGDIYGNCKTLYRYDDDRRITQVKYTDADGEPVNWIEGFAIMKKEYDRNGNLTENSFFGEDGAPRLCDDGYASVHISYKNNRVVKIAYFGTDGEPCIKNGGYASVTYSYTAIGNIKEARYFGSDGKPTTVKEGYSSAVYSYDKGGNITSVSFFDTNEEPVKAADTGFTTIEYSYADDGSQSEQSFKNEKSELIKTYTFDSEGNGTMITYYAYSGNDYADNNISKNVIFYENGVAVKAIVYDLNGNVFFEQDLAAQNRELDISERKNAAGIVIFHSEKTKSGVPVYEAMYYDSGSLRAEYFYDDNGELKKETVYNQDGTLSDERQYENGTLICESYLSEYGEYGMCLFTALYDSEGREIRFYVTLPDGREEDL